MRARVDPQTLTVRQGEESWPFGLDCADGSAEIELNETRYRVRALLWREKQTLARFGHLGEEFLRNQFLHLCVKPPASAGTSHQEVLLQLALWLNDPGADTPLPLNSRLLVKALADICRVTRLAPDAFDDRPAHEVESLWQAVHRPGDRPDDAPGLRDQFAFDNMVTESTKIVILPDDPPDIDEESGIGREAAAQQVTDAGLSATTTPDTREQSSAGLFHGRLQEPDPRLPETAPGGAESGPEHHSRAIEATDRHPYLSGAATPQSERQRESATQTPGRAKVSGRFSRDKAPAGSQPTTGEPAPVSALPESRPEFQNVRDRRPTAANVPPLVRPHSLDSHAPQAFAQPALAVREDFAAYGMLSPTSVIQTPQPVTDGAANVRRVSPPASRQRLNGRFRVPAGATPGRAPDHPTIVRPIRGNDSVISTQQTNSEPGSVEVGTIVVGAEQSPGERASMASGGPTIASSTPGWTADPKGASLDDLIEEFAERLEEAAEDLGINLGPR